MSADVTLPEQKLDSNRFFVQVTGKRKENRSKNLKGFLQGLLCNCMEPATNEKTDVPEATYRAPREVDVQALPVLLSRRAPAFQADYFEKSTAPQSLVHGVGPLRPRIHGSAGRDGTVEHEEVISFERFVSPSELNMPSSSWQSQSLGIPTKPFESYSQNLGSSSTRVSEQWHMVELSAPLSSPTYIPSPR